MHGECTYCKFDASHPSMTPSDWSIEDWDGKKVKAREQHPLLDFNQLEKTTETDFTGPYTRCFTKHIKQPHGKELVKRFASCNP